MFKLEEIDGKIYCIINCELKYIFIRNKNKNKYWEAFNVKDGKAFGNPIGSDKYRFDLAERLDVGGL